MKNAFVLARKDLWACLNSWVGVFVFSFFFLIAGIFFYLLVMSYARICMNASQDLYQNVQGLGFTRFVFGSFFLNMGAVLIFVVPLLSMRAFAEERKDQTLELLFTYPFSDFEIVWGKFLGMTWVYELMILPILGYALLAVWLGCGLDWGPIVIGLIGFWLLGNAYLSLGLFISSISENPVVSAIITFSALVIFWILDWVSGVVDGGWAHFFTSLSPLAHYRDFTVGILDLSHVVYFCFFYFYFLFLSLRAIETRNWRG